MVSEEVWQQTSLHSVHVSAGVSVGTRAEEAGAWMTSLLGLLPSPVGPSAKAPPPDTPEALQYIAVLQCLQRLVSAPALAGVMLSTTGARVPPFPCLPPQPVLHSNKIATTILRIIFLTFVIT